MCLLKLFPTKVPCTSAENCFLPGILAERRATHHFCLPVQPESAPTRQPWHGSSSRLSWLHDGDFLISLRWLFHEWSSFTMISVQSFKVIKMTLTICQARTTYCTETLGNLKIYYTLMLLSSSLNIFQSESVLLPLIPRNLWRYEASYATLSRCVFPKDFHCHPIDPLRWSCLSKPTEIMRLFHSQRKPRVRQVTGWLCRNQEAFHWYSRSLQLRFWATKKGLSQESQSFVHNKT